MMPPQTESIWIPVKEPGRSRPTPLTSTFKPLVQRCASCSGTSRNCQQQNAASSRLWQRGTTLTSSAWNKHTSTWTCPTVFTSPASTLSITHSTTNMVDVSSSISDAIHVSSSSHWDVTRVGGYHIVNIYKPPSEHWSHTHPLPTLPHGPHPAILVGNFNSHHPDWGYQDTDQDRESFMDWASTNDLLLVYDTKQRGTFCSARC